MAINKVVYGNTTLIDLSTDTASAADVASGKTLHLNTGETATGSLSFSTIHTGSSTPSSSLGVNGDIYLQVGN